MKVHYKAVTTHLEFSKYKISGFIKMLTRQIIISSPPRKIYFCDDITVSILDALFQVWCNIKSKIHLPNEHNLHLTESRIIAIAISHAKAKNKICLLNSTTFHLRQDKLSTGSILLNNPIHAGAMCDVSHGVVAEVSDAAMPWLFVEPVGTTVPGVIR